MREGVTVLGNVAVDRVNGGPPSAGGCPAFAIRSLERARSFGRVVTQGRANDRALFEHLTANDLVRVDFLDADQTNGFGLWYDGDDRTLHVDALGPCWDDADVRRAEVDTTWVHVAPLLQGEFGSEAIATLAKSGHRLSYDGQGLVRRPLVGPLRRDRAYDPGILSHLSVLKIADDEAHVLANGRFSSDTACSLGVPEILVTFGSAGCDLYVNGVLEHVPADRNIVGVQTTGAGDAFTVAYVAGRARDLEPRSAATWASQVVADMLQLRASETIAP